MAKSIKSIAKTIIKNFSDTDNIVDGVKTTVSQASKEAKKVTQKVFDKAGDVANKGVSDDLINRLKDEKNKAGEIHKKNVLNDGERKRRIKNEIDDVLNDPDLVSDVIDGNEEDIDGLLKDRKKKIKEKYDLSPEEYAKRIGENVNYYSSNAKYYGAQIGSKTKKYAGKFGETMFDVTKNGDKFTGYDFNLTGKGKAVAFGAMGLYGAYTLGNSAFEFSDMGEIEGGISVGTINETYSKEFDKMLNYANSSPKGINEFNKVTMGDNLSSSLNNVNPEIVFALHELRNGGGR